MQLDNLKGERYLYQELYAPEHYIADTETYVVNRGENNSNAVISAPVTNQYVAERQVGHTKAEAIEIAHKACTLSILTSGFSFFFATFGVSIYSKVDMIGSICTLLSRGALISMIAVLFLLPSLFYLLDGVIIRTSKGFRK